MPRRHDAHSVEAVKMYAEKNRMILRKELFYRYVKLILIENFCKWPYGRIIFVSGRIDKKYWIGAISKKKNTLATG